MNISTENIKLQMAGLRGQILSTLIGTAMGGENETASFADILAGKTSALDGLDLSGRNPSLRDPEAAYRMMTQINRYEVDFKAQHAELGEMGSFVERMEEAGNRLGEIGQGTANADIAAQLQAFVDQYNAWEDRFDHTVDEGGVLDNIQAAEISLWELEQSVRSIFNGAADGVRGLADLGIEIDPVSKQASFDSGKLSALLATNKAGVVNAIDEFSANFAKSADLLNAEGNFIPNALDNRSRAIQYIAENRTSLQTEFGTGEAAKPGGEVAKALAAYNAAYGIG